MSQNDLLARREDLLAEARRHRYRLHLMPDLTRALRETTTDLLRLEMASGRRTIEPLGDAGPVGNIARARLPYRDT